MSNAILNVARKKSSMIAAQAKAAEMRISAAKIEESAQEDLENVVAFVIASRSASRSAVAKELGCSRDKVEGMIRRANKRNTDLMRGVKNGD